MQENRITRPTDQQPPAKQEAILARISAVARKLAAGAMAAALFVPLIARAQTGPAPPLARGECKMEPHWNVAVGTAHVMPTGLRGVGITQRLNQQIPLGLEFRNAKGQTVTLGRYFGKKPVILSLVYFDCPMLCPLEERGLLHALKLLNFTAGKQFNVVTVSFDPHDTPGIAAEKKSLYTRLYGRSPAADGWHFLTGNEKSIAALTHAVGFHYKYLPQTGMFAHAVAIMVLTPRGKLAQYFYGIKYPAGNLRLALVTASHGKIGSPVDTMILYCYHYDPHTDKYTVVISHVLALGGGLTLLLIGGLIFFLIRSSRRVHPTQES